MKYFSFILLFQLAVWNTFSANITLAEFALFPDQYKSFLAAFGGEKSYYVGYSLPEKNWPYVLPGPQDSWAGGGYWTGYYPRHFPSFSGPFGYFTGGSGDFFKMGTFSYSLVSRVMESDFQRTENLSIIKTALNHLNSVFCESLFSFDSDKLPFAEGYFLIYLFYWK